MKKDTPVIIDPVLELAKFFNIPISKRSQFLSLVDKIFESKRNFDLHPKEIFVFGSNKRLGNQIAKLLKAKPAPYEIKCFEDNERIPHQIQTVREKDVYIIFTSQKGKSMDKWRNDYLAFVKNIKWGEPYRITVVLPLWYQQRADVENFKLREAKMSTFFAEQLKTVGVNRIITCKLHNPASSTTDPPMTNIGTSLLIVNHIKTVFSDLSKILIASGDMGGAKYARKIALLLGVPVLITDKNRDSKTGDTQTMNIYSDEKISEEIDTVLFVDDVMSTGGTLTKSAKAISMKFPHIDKYIAIITHADFVNKTAHNITNSLINSIWATDTVPIYPSFIKKMREAGKEVKIISVSRLIARVIDNLHNNVPISELWINGNGIK